MRLLLLLAVAALPLFAQDSAEERIQVDVNVVNVPVTVTDNEGHFIVDLKREDFDVYERHFTPASNGQMRSLLTVRHLYQKQIQIDLIHHAVTPGHRADIAQRIIRAPGVDYHAYVNCVDNPVAVEVDDRIDR